MEIRNSEKTILLYSWLTVVMLIILTVLFLVEMPVSTNARLVFSGFEILLLALVVYLFSKANEKKLLYKITENEFIDIGRSEVYNFSDLKYFRHEKIIARVNVDYVYLYDEHKDRIGNIKLTATDKSPEEVCLFLKDRLTKL